MKIKSKSKKTKPTKHSKTTPLIEVNPSYFYEVLRIISLYEMYEKQDKEQITESEYEILKTTMMLIGDDHEKILKDFSVWQSVHRNFMRLKIQINSYYIASGIKDTIENKNEKLIKKIVYLTDLDLTCRDGYMDMSEREQIREEYYTVKTILTALYKGLKTKLYKENGFMCIDCRLP